MKELDLVEGVNPAEFVLESRVEFLHVLKRLARSFSNPDLNDRELQSVSQSFATDMGNYRLVLGSLQQKATGYARGLFDVLMVYMNEAWNGRDTLRREADILADGMALAYTNLADYFESETAE